jgi:hypothetical protein
MWARIKVAVMEGETKFPQIGWTNQLVVESAECRLGGGIVENAVCLAHDSVIEASWV